MINPKTTKRIICSLTAILVLSLTSFDARAGMSVMASSGRPYNGSTWSNFTIKDGTVEFDACNIGWLLPIPVPYSTNVVTYNVSGMRSSLVAMDACVLDHWGNWKGCYSMSSSGSASVDVPANGGSLFVRATIGGCVQNPTFEGAWITN